MKRLSAQAYRKLIDGAEVLATRDGADRVLRQHDGTIIKLFAHKGKLATSRVRSHAVRFLRSSRRLQKLGIATVEVVDTFRLSHEDRDAVVYLAVPGRPLRDRFATAPLDQETFETLMDQFIAYTAEVHGKGVYFRGMHMGNVVLRPDGAFGLIDITDCRFRKRPLSCSQRIRNFRPLCVYRTDREAILAYGVDRFLAEYSEHAGLSQRVRQRISRAVQHLLNERIRKRPDVHSLALEGWESPLEPDRWRDPATVRAAELHRSSLTE